MDTLEKLKKAHASIAEARRLLNECVDAIQTSEQPLIDEDVVINVSSDNLIDAIHILIGKVVVNN